MFEELNKRAQETKEHWKSINNIIKQINVVLNSKDDTRNDQLTELNTALLLLLAEQLRPINDMDMQSLLSDVLSDIGINNPQ